MVGWPRPPARVAQHTLTAGCPLVFGRRPGNLVLGRSDLQLLHARYDCEHVYFQIGGHTHTYDFIEDTGDEDASIDFDGYDSGEDVKSQLDTSVGTFAVIPAFEEFAELVALAPEGRAIAAGRYAATRTEDAEAFEQQRAA